MQPVEQATERKVFGDDQRQVLSAVTRPTTTASPRPLYAWAIAAPGTSLSSSSSGTAASGNAARKNATPVTPSARTRPRRTALLPPQHFGAEVERQARADEEQSGRRCGARRVVGARSRHGDVADVAQLDDAHHDQQDELRRRDHAERPRAKGEPARARAARSRPAAPAPTRRDSGLRPGKTGVSSVVDDRGDRVRQIEEVGEDPDPAVDERDAPPHRGSTKAVRPPDVTTLPENANQIATGAANSARASTTTSAADSIPSPATPGRS